MKKDRVLKGAVTLQAICFIVLTVVVVTRVLTPSDPSIASEGEVDNGGDSSNASAGIAAVIGGEVITKGAFQRELELQYGETVLRTMLVRTAIQLEADAYELAVSPEELQSELDRMIAGYESEEQFYAVMQSQLGMSPDAVREEAAYRLLLEKIATRTVEVSDEEIDAYIDENKSLFEPHVHYRLAWIVVSDKQEAAEVLDKLAAGESFEHLAQTRSLDKDTAESGGDLGMIDSDDPFIDHEVLQAAGAMKAGDNVGPIAVEQGQAIIHLADRHEDRPIDDAEKRGSARKQVALSKAMSLQEVEEQLLKKYDAQVVAAAS
ncbi:peptidyl-prolyl cis-trans isomerase [Paenibacillus sp. GCM10027626]|uniref:peptidyl-prolyl cis-trans isomerase n=1 Tax=Paenibacillus sp. GCM10027626 TaxID=3273411 RepID=UPI00363FBB1B